MFLGGRLRATPPVSMFSMAFHAYARSSEVASRRNTVTRPGRWGSTQSASWSGLLAGRGSEPAVDGRDGGLHRPSRISGETGVIGTRSPQPL